MGQTTGQGRVSADECLASCMRQSPDRIFLAELRGAEDWEYLNSLNTGHPGSITTIHANSALDTFDRVATLAMKSQAAKQLELAAVRDLIWATVDVVVYMASEGGGNFLRPDFPKLSTWLRGVWEPRAWRCVKTHKWMSRRNSRCLQRLREKCPASIEQEETMIRRNRRYWESA